MFNFEYCVKTKLIVGKDVEKDVAKYVKEFGGTKVLVHHDSAYTKECGLVDAIIQYLKEAGLAVFELGGVVPNPHLSLVYEGIELCKKEGIDFILPVGGGSVIDSAKAIAIGVPYDGDVWDFYAEQNGAPAAFPAASLPVGVVLTIAATGSETSWSSIITKADENLKRFIDNEYCRPVFAIENPELTYSLPPFQTFAGITDIMSHSMERYFGDQQETDPLSDHLCEAIFTTCMECARTLKKDPKNYDARANVMVASGISHNGLTGIGRAQDWASHMMEHELGGEFQGVTHGAGLAIIIPAWMRYVYKDNMTIFTKFAVRVMGVTYDYNDPETTVLEGIDRLEAFFRSIGMPTRMSELPQITSEVTEEVMRKMAKRVRITNPDDGTIGGVRHLNEEDIVNIFKMCK